MGPSGGGITVTGDDHEVAVTRPNGKTTSHTARRARIKLSALPRRGTLRVAIVATDALGRSGPLTKARLR